MQPDTGSCEYDVLALSYVHNRVVLVADDHFSANSDPPLHSARNSADLCDNHLWPASLQLHLFAGCSHFKLCNHEVFS